MSHYAGPQPPANEFNGLHFAPRKSRSSVSNGVTDEGKVSLGLPFRTHDPTQPTKNKKISTQPMGWPNPWTILQSS